MADISNQLDKLASDIAKKGLVAQEEITVALMEIVKGKSAEEAAVILSTLNIEEMMAAKLAGAFALFDAGVITVLENTYTSVYLSEATLLAMLETSKSFIAAEFINKTSALMRQEIVKGISTGLVPNQVVSKLIDLGVNERHLTTIVNTGYSQYSNSIKKMMFDKVPNATKFVYVGAYDGKTRPACENKILSSPATKLEVLSKFGNFDNEVWNCRHSWEEVTSDVVGQGFRQFKTEL